ncbi:hypothetical protein FOZ62_018999, partial [Perkinsus olseni]
RRDDMRDRISKLSDSTPNNSRNGPSGAITEARRLHKEANDWARKQNFVVIIMGKALRSSTTTDPGFCNASDVRFLVSRQGKRYGLLAFDSKADAEKTIAEYFSNKDSYSLLVGDCRLPLISTPTLTVAPPEPDVGPRPDHLSHALTDDLVAAVGDGHHLPEISLSLLLSQSSSSETY